MRHGLMLFLPALLGAAQPAARDMSLTTPDGFTIKGTLTVPAAKGPRPVVILAHQFQGDRNGWKPLTDGLNARGIATLALDLRGHGQSTSKGGAKVAASTDFKAASAEVGFQNIPSDLALAAKWVRKQPRIDGRRLGLAGSSVGAYAALAAAPDIHPVAVLALSPAGGWGEKPELRIARAAEQAKAAVFVFASKDDGEAADNAAALKPVFGVHVRLVPGKEHGFDYLPANAETMAGWFMELLHRHPPARKEAPKEEAPKAETPAR
jgi:dienelactone hydrolase